MRVCVAGDSGLLGQAFAHHAAQQGWEVLGVSTAAEHHNLHWNSASPSAYSHERFDLTHEQTAFFRRLEKWRPDALVNCAGLADVAACQKDPDLAETLNAVVPDGLARFSLKEGIRFVHISTDQVFDGKASRPYQERDEPSPLHVYGRTKLRGERSVASANEKALIVRTNIVGFRGSEGRPTFIEWLFRALAERQKILLADDFVTSSIHASSLSALICGALRLSLSGTFNISTEDGVSKYEFGRLFAQELGLDFSCVTKGRLDDLKLDPERARYLALDTTKIRKILKVPLPRIADTVSSLAEDLKMNRAGASLKT